MNQRAVSPCREEVWLLVAEGNCVAVRRGGEQPEANDSSATQVNSIRPVTLASLLVNGEAQVTIRPTGTGVPGPRRPVTRGEARASKPKRDNREGQGWLEAEGSEGSRPKQGSLSMQGIADPRESRSKGAT